MPHFSEQKTLAYSAEQLFDLISDVASYPEFLPWCRAARVQGVTEKGFNADVVIGFKLFRERFTSRVRLVRPKEITVDYIRGPMKHLYNHWRLEELSDGSCFLDFEVDFEFKNGMLEEMMSGLFEKACHKMMTAFEERADFLYGPV